MALSELRFPTEEPLLPILPAQRDEKNQAKAEEKTGTSLTARLGPHAGLGRVLENEVELHVLLDDGDGVAPDLVGSMAIQQLGAHHNISKHGDCCKLAETTRDVCRQGARAPLWAMALDDSKVSRTLD